MGIVVMRADPGNCLLRPNFLSLEKSPCPMRIAFTVIWTFGIIFFYTYSYVSAHHHRPPMGLTVFVSFAAVLSAYGIIYLWHKAKKDNDDNTPSTWL